MKRKNFIYLGAAAVLACTLLSCGSELDLSSYTEITETEAQTIINNFDAESALAEVNTLVVEVSVLGLVEGVYYIDFNEDSLYLYFDANIDTTDFDFDSLTGTGAVLITGSDDSYTAYIKTIESGTPTVASQEFSYTEAKSFIDSFTSQMLSNLLFNEALITDLEYYGEVSYSTYSDYIKFQVTNEEKEDENNYGSVNYYAIYNTNGLMRYMYQDISVTTNGETTSYVNYISAEYNVTLTKKTSLE